MNLLNEEIIEKIIIDLNEAMPVTASEEVKKDINESYRDILRKNLKS